MSAIIKRYGDPVKGVKSGVYGGNLAVAINVTAQAKALAPVKEGQLRNGIMYKVAKPDGGVKDGGFNDQPGDNASKEISVIPKQNEAYVGDAVEHAIYKEFGTRYMAPKPFLRPAIAIVAKGADTAQTIAKIQRETMNGALKGVKSFRVFREKF